MSQEVSGRAAIGETWPFFVMVSVVIGTAYVTALRADATLREPLRFALFTALIVLAAVLYWLCPLFVTTGRRRLPFLAILAAATFAIGLMTPQHWAVFGLYPALIGLAVGMFWSDLRAIAVAVAICLGLLAVNLGLAGWLRQALSQLPFIGIALVFTVIYVVLFNRQVEARQRAQELLSDLESAHARLREYADQVEELTLARERERMGHELHDTLAQGLAGLIMQLEAIDSHLDAGNAERARAVLKQAMQRSRTTLHEARRAIQALRASVLDHGDLAHALRREAEGFAASTGTPCSCDVDAGSLVIPPERAQEILRIVQECLSNAARHAHASYVEVRLSESSGELRIVVSDDGVGFNPDDARSGFGLTGMQERAARLGGTLRVKSRRGSGTTIELVTRERQA
jgi:NarL family two-component system sensor histidine kinase YdfH